MKVKNDEENKLTEKKILVTFIMIDCQTPHLKSLKLHRRFLIIFWVK